MTAAGSLSYKSVFIARTVCLPAPSPSLSCEWAPRGRDHRASSAWGSGPSFLSSPCCSCSSRSAPSLPSLAAACGRATAAPALLVRAHPPALVTQAAQIPPTCHNDTIAATLITIWSARSWSCSHGSPCNGSGSNSPVQLLGRFHPKDNLPKGLLNAIPAPVCER